MEALADDDVTDRNARAAAAATERLCIATRQVRPVGALIRFVVGPDGAVVPDIKRRLPGRGAWVTARRHAVAEAVRRRLFSRAFKAEVRVSPGLTDEVEGLLELAALNGLSMAHKAGLVVQGFAKVEAAVASAPVAALVRARDAGEESGRKLAHAFRRGAGPGAGGKTEAGEEKIVEAFTSTQLDLALGRLNVVHAALLAGRASEAFLVRWRFLEDFRADTPV
jgi:predicted RNA-binding protein YlxR (DUF448 family)